MFVGLTLVEKWNTDNVLGTEVSVEDRLVQGLKLSFDALFAPQTGCENSCVYYSLVVLLLFLCGHVVAVTFH